MTATEKEIKKAEAFKELMNLKWKRLQYTKMFLSERWETLTEKEKETIKAEAEELDRKIANLEMLYRKL
jgi:hypothetical protein